MIALPIFCSLIALACSIVMFRDAVKRPRPDKVIWGVAFALFAIAAGADSWGRGVGWTTWLAKSYYASGVALVVTFLAIGQLYLLFPRVMQRFGVGATLLITALWVSLVINAPIDSSRLAEDGWEAIDRGPEMVAISVAINAIGTLIIVGGTAWTVWNFWRKGIQRNRMYGCSLILVGTLAVAAGGSLTRLGHYEYLYIAMALGIVLIFAGVLLARMPSAGATAIMPGLSEVTPANEPGVSEPMREIAPAPATGLAYVEHLLLQFNTDDIGMVCTEWSVPREPANALSRNDARRAWRFRSLLSEGAVVSFDQQDVPTRRQLTTLYHDVLAWERPPRDDIAEVVPPAESVAIVRRSDSSAD